MSALQGSVRYELKPQAVRWELNVTPASPVRIIHNLEARPHMARKLSLDTQAQHASFQLFADGKAMLVRALPLTREALEHLSHELLHAAVPVVAYARFELYITGNTRGQVWLRLDMVEVLPPRLLR